MTGHKGTPKSQYNSLSAWAELKNNPAEKAITNIRNMGGTEETADQETSC